MYACDEHGVQGRFNERIGQVLSAVSQRQNLGFFFGDFQCSISEYNDPPDIGRSDSRGGNKKTPWVSVHKLERRVQEAYKGAERELRHYLGQ